MCSFLCERMCSAVSGISAGLAKPLFHFIILTLTSSIPHCNLVQTTCLFLWTHRWATPCRLPFSLCLVLCEVTVCTRCRTMWLFSWVGAPSFWRVHQKHPELLGTSPTKCASTGASWLPSHFPQHAPPPSLYLLGFTQHPGTADCSPSCLLLCVLNSDLIIYLPHYPILFNWDVNYMTQNSLLLRTNPVSELSF